MPFSLLVCSHPRGRGPPPLASPDLAQCPCTFARRQEQTRPWRKPYAAQHTFHSATRRVINLAIQALVGERRSNSHVFHSCSCPIEHPHELQQKYVLRSVLSELDVMGMEPDHLHTTPPTGLPQSRVRQRQQPAQREYPRRSPTLRQGRTPKDQKLRRTTARPVGHSDSPHEAQGEGAPPSRSATVKLYSPTITQPKSLLPLTERSSQEDKHPLRKFTKASHHDATLDITPDGGSAGREGRQFAVWNVGNNGRIYLRYVVWSR